MRNIYDRVYDIRSNLEAVLIENLNGQSTVSGLKNVIIFDILQAYILTRKL